MLPSVPSLPNQIHPQSSNNQVFQQGMQFNPDQRNPAAFNHQPQLPIRPHGQNPCFAASPMPSFGNQPNPMPGLSFPSGPNVPSMNQVGGLLPQGQFSQQFPIDSVNQMMVLQLLQQHLQQNNLVQLLQNNLGQLQNNNHAALMQAGNPLGGSNMPPNLNHLAVAMQMGQLYSQNQTLVGNQLLPSQFPQQQQQQALNTLPPLNFPPSIQPGNVGNALMFPCNMNSNPGKIMFPNKAMQSKSQTSHMLDATTITTTTAQQQHMSSMHTVNVPPNHNVMADSNSNTGSAILLNQAMLLKNQNPHLSTASNMIGQQQAAGSMQKLDGSAAQMVLANSNLNIGNALLSNKSTQCKAGNPHPFTNPTSTGQQQPVNSMQTTSHPPAQMFLASSNSVFGNAMLLNGALQGKNQSANQFTAPIAPGQRTNQGPATSMQNFQPVGPHFPMIMQQTLMSMQSNGHWQPQMNHVVNKGQHISGAISGFAASQKVTRNFHGFQNSQFHHMKNAKRNTGCINNSRKGQPAQSRQGMKHQLPGCTEQPQTEQRRPIRFKYTASEVLRWREARKRNFPTREKKKEKLAKMSRSSERNRKRIDTDEDAKLRRKQLREILAKQEELGVPVAEIPAQYLAEPSNPSKKSKVGNEISAAPADTAETREPAPVQKMPCADIKRDRSMLLQAFRFMALNSFFEQWPKKPVEFPVVTIEDGGCKNKGNPPQDEMVTEALVVGKDAMDEERSEGGKDETDEEGNDDGEDETDEETTEDSEDESEEEASVDSEDESEEEASEVGYSCKEGVRNNPMGRDHVCEQAEKPEEGEITD